MPAFSAFQLSDSIGDGPLHEIVFPHAVDPKEWVPALLFLNLHEPIALGKRFAWAERWWEITARVETEPDRWLVGLDWGWEAREVADVHQA